MRYKIGSAYGTAIALTFGLALLSTGSASAATCLGNCGTSIGTDGVVTAPPSGSPYNWLSTNGGDPGEGQISSEGQGGGVETGTTFKSSVFAAGVGDTLEFYFNYVTSDGSGFADYTWAELLTDASVHVAWLFTARTVPAPGDTSPGFDLPANEATLIPPTSAIIPGGPVWSPLGGSSGACFNGPTQGCGYTGWIQSTFDILAAGNYILALGVTNWGDSLFDSGLAWGGANIEGDPIDPVVPLPAALPLLAGALGGLGMVGRWRKRRQSQAIAA